MSEADEPLTLNQVLVEELRCLRPELTCNAPAPADLKEIYEFIDTLSEKRWCGASGTGPLSALCLSGGGIRSATFNLGVIQALARIGLLGKFDYLSSVSGGGYIASWLRAWMQRRGVGAVAAELGRGAKLSDPLATEPQPITNLRDYSNYLTPALGLFSGDTWAAAATIVRNLLLNWLVLIPLLAAVVGVPLLLILCIRAAVGTPQLSHVCGYLALAAELVATLLVFGARRFKKSPETSQGFFIFVCVLPICIAAALLSTAGVALDPDTTAVHPPWLFASLWSAMPIVGWGLVELLTWLVPAVQDKTDSRQVCVDIELAALVTAGAVWTVGLAKTTQWWFPFFFDHPALYAVFVLPVLLGEYLLSRVVFIGVTSLNDARSDRIAGQPGVRSRVSSNDSDREWWSRLSGWVLLLMLGWVAVTGACILGCYLPTLVRILFPVLKEHQAGVTLGVNLTVSIVGAISGAIAALTSSSSKAPAGAESPTKPPPAAVKRVLALTGPLFVLCLIMMLSWSVKALGARLIHDPSHPFRLHFFWSMQEQTVPWSVPREFLLLLAGLAVAGVIASLFVNVNRFSLHGMYRNRLVRAYLGASNCATDEAHERRPDPFTGFALNDNFALKDLCSHEGSQTVVPPLSIINTTLNLVNGNKLAWQQRKAESFSMTPLFCGSWREGYRRSKDYGGPGGVTVGTAVTISGAAANPNMGYSSSPVLSFLMAMFNVRLGAWLGNTNRNGEHTYRNPGPSLSILPLIAEMFGLTNSNRSYVNLSDGGHFDNLGLYEVVLRRCRYVLVSDAGQDGSFSFEDLGNSIRKIRIDFGINIEFDRIQILPNTPEKEGLCCATARIRYSDVDDTPAEHDGLLVYIKPTIRGRGTQVPYDIYSYSRECEAFPHESTADQWFSESQFESYRALGSHIMAQLSRGLGSNVDACFTEFHASVETYLATTPGAQASPAMPP